MSDTYYFAKRQGDYRCPQVEDHEIEGLFHTEDDLWVRLRSEGETIGAIRGLLATGPQEFLSAIERLQNYLIRFPQDEVLRLYNLDDDPERGYILGLKETYPGIWEKR